MVLRFASIFLLCLLVIGCDSTSLEVREKEEAQLEPMTTSEAQNLFILHCESCHGLDGKKQAAGAADLSKTSKSDAEILHIILYGNDKGMMPYKELLTKREQTGLVEFVKTLQ